MSIKLVASRDLRTSTPPVALLAVVLALTLFAAEPTPAAAAPRGQQPVLMEGVGMGAKPSAAVRAMQRRLDRRGYDLGAPGVDGRFGPITDGAVRRLQRDAGLDVDGIVGPRTHRALRRPGGTAHTKARRPAARTKPKPRTKRSSGTPRARSGAPAARTAPSAPGRDVRRDEGDQSGDVGWLGWLAAAAALAALLGIVAVTVESARARSRRAEDQAPPVRQEPPAEREPEPEPDPEPTPPGGGRPLEHLEAGLMESSHHVGAVTVPAETNDPPAEDRDARRMIGYVTIGPDDVRDAADAPAQAIGDAARQAGWQLVDVVIDRENGRPLTRPGLTYALKEIVHGNAAGLVVSDLRRLTTSTMDLGALLDWLGRAGASLVALDLDVDTATPGGREVAAALIRLGGWERERHADRTRHGMAEVRAHGESAGRPAVSDRPDLLERITAMRAEGMTLQAIADRLNAEGEPTLRGGAKWRPSSVQAALGYRRPGTRDALGRLPSLKEGSGA